MRFDLFRRLFIERFTFVLTFVLNRSADGDFFDLFHRNLLEVRS